MLHHKGLKKKVIELVFEEILSQELMQSFFLNEVKEETTKENLWVTKGDNYGYSYLKVYSINNKKG